jgi:hypothetical protein
LPTAPAMSLPSVVQVTALLTTLGLLRPTTGSRPGSNLATSLADTCRPIEFRGEVEHGRAWERELGGGLVFRLAPSADPVLPGWTIEVRSLDLPEDENELSWVVTLPYRGWNPRYLDVSYGLTAREVVRSRRAGVRHRTPGRLRTNRRGRADLAMALREDRSRVGECRPDPGLFAPRARCSRHHRCEHQGHPGWPWPNRAT